MLAQAIPQHQLPVSSHYEVALQSSKFNVDKFNSFDKISSLDKFSKFDKFDKLVMDLKAALGPSSGLTSDDVDVAHLEKLMRDYVASSSNEHEWQKLCFGDATRGYTRNLVDEGNGKSNLLLLVWSPGKGSPIHDHGNAHCLMKILKGSLTETRYAFPNSDKIEPMKVIAERTLPENAVAYMADELGVHRVTNPGEDFAISLHLYTPPNVAKGGCHIFDVNTSQKSHIASCGYYSAYGRLLHTDGDLTTAS